MTCPVCLDECSQGSVYTPPCQHVICSDCRAKMQRFNLDTCPVCRAPYEVAPNSKSLEVELRIRRRRRNLTVAEFRERRLSARRRAKERSRWKTIRFSKTIGLGSTLTENERFLHVSDFG